MSIKMGKIERYINEELERKGALFFMFLDPVDYRTPDDAVRMGASVVKDGADVLLIGGSTSAQGELLDYVAKRVKEKIDDVPVVLFPGNIATVTKHADADTQATEPQRFEA